MAPHALSLFDLVPGKTLLGQYTIRRSHRHGGMSTTFEVDDLKGGGPGELQVFPAGLFEKQAQALEFAGSLRQWSRVHDKHVVAVRDVHSLDDGSVLLVTDMPKGESLRIWQRAHSVTTPHDVVEIGKQLLDGLDAIHGAGLVHGDIKPHTIHLEMLKKPHVQLVDGGITPGLWTAKHLGDKTALIGTPFYAPIEQFGGESPNVSSDIYNVATVLYELASGVIPWKGKSFIEVFQAKLEPRPPSMKMRAPKVDVPQELEEVIMGGLMAKVEQRFASAEEFRKHLAALKFQ
ncbi:MAG: serine/threonine protein kinase [Planctomycetia bacterium]